MKIAVCNGHDSAVAENFKLNDYNVKSRRVKERDTFLKDCISYKGSEVGARMEGKRRKKS